MASIQKQSLAFVLFGLVAMGAILAWYFTYSGASSYDYSFEGVDESGNKLRATANYVADPYGGYSTRIDYEVINNPASATTWAIFKSAYNYAESDPWFGFMNINYGDAAWICTKVSNGNQSQNGGTGTSFDSLGLGVFSAQGAAGGLTYFTISGASTGAIYIPVAVSNAGVTNYGGFSVTSFKFGAASLVSFKTGLPALPALSSCANYAANESEAVVESDAAPVCTKFASLFAFLQKRTYATNAAANFCTGSATAAVCGATMSKTDTVLIWTGTDRAFSCTNASYGTILSVSGSDDLTDWLKNLLITTKSWNGMTTHNGFLSKYNTWAAQYTTWMGSATKITFNGHSLGGAVSTIAAVAKKAASPTATVQMVTCGCPAAFKAPHSAAFTGMVHKRHVNFEQKPWYLPNQRDVVSAVTGVVGFSHASTHALLSQTLNGGSWSSAATSVTALIGDVQISLHSLYTTSLDTAAATF